MSEKIKGAIASHWKRYVISTVTSFLAGFALAVLPDLDALTWEVVVSGSWVGVLFGGVRGGVKLVMEMYLMWYQSR